MSAGWILRGLAGLAVVLGGVAGAVQADESGVIRGLVFVDANANLIQDEDEPGFAGVQLTLTSGDTSLDLLTDEAGRFDLPVEPGVWQVSLAIPEGYAALNDATRQVTLAPDLILEAVMSFALGVPAPPETLEPEPVEPEPEAPVDADLSAEAEVPLILPETGADLPAVVWLALGLTGLMVIGVALLFISRSPAARP